MSLARTLLRRLHPGRNGSDRRDPQLLRMSTQRRPAGRLPDEPRFKLLTIEEILAKPDPAWIVDGIMMEQSLGQLYGDSGVGKSFVALDIALSVATGRPWLSRFHVRQGAVLYVAAEGHAGIKRRIAAWLDHHGLEPTDAADFRLLGEALPLGSHADVESLIKVMGDAADSKEYALVVLDTQARCTEGLDENSAKEMGLAVEATERIKRTTSAALLLIHHSGYEGNHARGSTAVKAAIDMQMSLRRHPPLRITLACEKQKDWEEFAEVQLSLLDVGDSLVPVQAKPDSPLQLRLNAQSLTQNQDQAFEALRGHPQGLRAGEWQEASGLVHSSFYAALKALVDAHLVGNEAGLYTAVDLKSNESSRVQSKSNGAGSGGVQQSTTPLGGGLVDFEASGPSEGVDVIGVLREGTNDASR